MDKLDPDDPRPPFRQLAARLADSIEQGEYEQGARLPSYEQLAEAYGVAIGTAKRAVGALREEGLVVIRHGLGTFVRSAAHAEDRSRDPLADIRAQLDDFGRRLEALERRFAEIDR